MQRATDNERVTPADFDQFCVTAPTDSRLPGGGGDQICGLSAIKPTAFGLSQPVVKSTSEFGKDIRRNQFFGVGLSACLAKGIRLGGGFDAGHSSKNQCFDIDSVGLSTYGTGLGQAHAQTATTVDEKRICEVTTPVKGLAMLKLNGSVPLPYEFSFSAIYQDQAGPAIDAVWAAPTAAIAPSLGRSLAGGAATQNVPLVIPNSAFEGRIRRLDLRMSKSINFTKRVRLQANVDAYNALNSNAIQTINTTYGVNWRQPQTILDPMIVQLSGVLTF